MLLGFRVLKMKTMVMEYECECCVCSFLKSCCNPEKIKSLKLVNYHSQVFGFSFHLLTILLCCSHAFCLEETQRSSAKSQLYKFCSVRHWKAPVYECIAEGPCHMIL